MLLQMLFLRLFFLSLDFDQSCIADRLRSHCLRKAQGSTFPCGWLKAEGPTKKSDKWTGELAMFCVSSED